MEDHWSFLTELPQKENTIYCWNLSNYLQISQFRKIFCQQLYSRKCHDFFVLLPSFFFSLSYLLSISFIIFASGCLDIFHQIFLTQPVVCCGILSAFTSFPPSPPLFFLICSETKLPPNSFIWYLNFRPVSSVWSLTLFYLASLLPLSCPNITFPVTFLSSYLFQMLVSQVAVGVVLGVVMLVNRPVTQSVLDTLCSEVFSWGFVAENSISGFKALEKAARITKTVCSAI